MRRARAAVAAFALGALLLTACSGGDGDAPELAAPDVGVQLFQLPWTTVAEECENTLGPAGYSWVLLSPAQEHIVGDEWWVSYQPVSYQIDSRLGTREEFAEMTERCAAVGVDIIADAVINHMTGQDDPGVGWAGSPYQHYSYPGLYEETDFHHCGFTANDDISDYTSREQVQTCELVNLADLDTASTHVQETIIDYLTDLLDLGVAGVRIDAAKHMAADDVEAIVTRLPDSTRVISEVIRSAREPVAPEEYEGFGEVFEFQYARDLFPQLQSGLLSDPRLDGKRPAHVEAEAAVVFIDNHDTERGEAALTYVNGDRYLMANALMLADDYGTPIVYSGYAFTDRDAGPETAADGTVTAKRCDGSGAQWEALPAGERTCVHAATAILGMIEWRRVAGDAARLPGVTEGDAYGFEREGRAVIAVNPGDARQTLSVPTSLPDGDYCDVIVAGPQAGEGECDVRVTVADGTATFTLDQGATSAIHLAARVE